MLVTATSVSEFDPGITHVVPYPPGIGGSSG